MKKSWVGAIARTGQTRTSWRWSKKIQDELQIAVSHVTLKRIWGKVKYTSLPNTFTLNTLVQFIGYEKLKPLPTLR